MAEVVHADSNTAILVVQLPIDMVVGGFVRHPKKFILCMSMHVRELVQICILFVLAASCNRLINLGPSFHDDMSESERRHLCVKVVYGRTTESLAYAFASIDAS